MTENIMSENLKIGLKESNGDTSLRMQTDDCTNPTTRGVLQNEVLEKKLEENRVQIEELLRENRVLTKRCVLALKQTEEVNKDFLNEKSKTRLLENEIRRLKGHDEATEEMKKLALKNARDTCTQTDHQDAVEILEKERQEKHKLREEHERLKNDIYTREEEINKLRDENARVTCDLKKHQGIVEFVTHSLQEELDDLKKERNVKGEEIRKLHAELARTTLALTHHYDIVTESKRQQQFEQTLQEELKWLKNKSCMTKKEMRKLRWVICRVISDLTYQRSKVKQLREGKNKRDISLNELDALKEAYALNDLIQEQIVGFSNSSLSGKETEKLILAFERVIRGLALDERKLREEQNKAQTLQETLYGLNQKICVTKEEIKKLSTQISGIARVFKHLENLKSRSI